MMLKTKIKLRIYNVINLLSDSIMKYICNNYILYQTLNTFHINVSTSNSTKIHSMININFTAQYKDLFKAEVVKDTARV